MLRTLLVRAVLTLAAIAFVGASGIYAASAARLSRDWQIDAAALDIPQGSATVARGRHVATAVAQCVDCHGVDLGGKLMVADPLLGTLAGPNLTRGQGGLGDQLGTEDWVRALRHGVGRDGEALVAMPSEDYARLGKGDIAALIAYARSLPPVDRELPETSLGPLGRVLLLSGELRLAAESIDHQAPLSDVPAKGPHAAYGRYLVEVGCVGCHGTQLSGGPMPGAPPGVPVPSNITPTGIGSWSKDELGRALRQGIRPDGKQLDRFMPWPTLSAMTDDDVSAVYAYLQTVEPRPFGQR